MPGTSGDKEGSAKTPNDPTPLPQQQQQQQEKLTPLFEALRDNDEAMLSFAEGFRDKVRTLFDHFDHDRDGLLKYDELAALQKATSGGEGEHLSEAMYVMACQSLNCHPDEGLSLEALKFTYAAEGADIDEDYSKVFDVATGKPLAKDAEETEEEKVYEIGSNGVVDISS